MNLSRSLVIFLVGGALLASCTSTPKHPPVTQSTPAPSPTPSQSIGPAPSKTVAAPTLPGGFVVVDSTWISDSVGWVLGGRGCAGTGCAALMKTTDGGAHWHRISAPPASVIAKGVIPPGNPAPETVSRIRFANSRIGYAFGSTFFMTTDGGSNWRKESVRLVDSLEISRGIAVRISYPNSGCPGPCDAVVERSAVGSTSWHRILSTSLSGVAFSVGIQSSNIYVAAFGNPAGGANDAHTAFWRSSDLGKTWTQFGDPCGSGTTGENDTRDFALASGGVLVLECVARGSGDAFLRVSTDGGNNFGPRRYLKAIKELDAVAAGSAGTIAVTYIRNGEGVAVSRDGGRTWSSTLSIRPAPESEQPIPPPGATVESFLGFQDARTARAAWGTAFIWTTRDGGNTWRRSAPFAGL